MERSNRKADGGCLVISLDFELMWGILDRSDPMEYKNNIEGVGDVIPEMLRLFEDHQIHATWGIVGLIACKSIADCRKNVPELQPKYTNENLSVYFHLNKIKNLKAGYLCAPELIKRIAETKYQEIASHTYSHYYCAEEGQSKEEFRYDLKKAKEALLPYNENVRSLIFPRNQLNENYTGVMSEEGFMNYRGNEKMWIYHPDGIKKGNSAVRRILRLMDHYISLSGYNCYDYSEIPDGHGLNNVRSSRFFRPYSRKLFFLEPARIHRIKRQMKYAAMHHKIFHIWWHPHNFGVNRKENFRNLTEIIKYYEFLNKRYGMRSLNMAEVGDSLKCMY